MDSVEAAVHGPKLILYLDGVTNLRHFMALQRHGMPWDEVRRHGMPMYLPQRRSSAAGLCGLSCRLCRTEFLRRPRVFWKNRNKVSGDPHQRQLCCRCGSFAAVAGAKLRDTRFRNQAHLHCCRRDSEVPRNVSAEQCFADKLPYLSRSKAA
jgi:hypothetical protein